MKEQLIGRVPEIQYENIFDLKSHKIDNVSYHIFRVQFKTNLKTNFPISMVYNLQPINPHSGLIYAGFVLVGLYVLIIFDVSFVCNLRAQSTPIYIINVKIKIVS